MRLALEASHCLPISNASNLNLSGGLSSCLDSGDAETDTSMEMRTSAPPRVHAVAHHRPGVRVLPDRIAELPRPHRDKEV